MVILQYMTSTGRQPVKEFIDELPIESQFEILTLLRRLEAGDLLGMPHARSMASMAHGLYELRVRDARGQIRLFYYTKIRNSIYLIHGLRKKSQTIPDKVRELILRRIKELTSRN